MHLFVTKTASLTSKTQEKNINLVKEVRGFAGLALSGEQGKVLRTHRMHSRFKNEKWVSYKSAEPAGGPEQSLDRC